MSVRLSMHLIQFTFTHMHDLELDVVSHNNGPSKKWTTSVYRVAHLPLIDFTI